jgi:ribosome-binding factor A
MAQGHRPDRVGEQIRDELSSLLARGAVHDPGIGFITLTRVKVSSDLQVAHVFYTSLGDEKARKETAKALVRATPFLRRQVGSALRLRRVPEIDFRFDESIGHQNRIEQILRDLHQEERRQGVPGDQEERRQGVPGDQEERRQGVPGDRDEAQPTGTADAPPASSPSETDDTDDE